MTNTEHMATPPYRLMIVDDEMAIRDKLPKLIDFELHGFQVVATARNGQEALERILSQPPDLLLLDVRMPVLDGLGLLAALEEKHGGLLAEMEVVILSGYSEFAYARQAMQHGVRAYLTKPIDEDELIQHLETLRQRLNHRRVQRQVQADRDAVTEMRRAWHELKHAPIPDHYGILHIMTRHADEADEEDETNENTTASQRIAASVAACLARERSPLFARMGAVHAFLVPYELLPHLAADLNRDLRQSGLEASFLIDDLSIAGAADGDTRSLRMRCLDTLDALMTAAFYDEQHILTASQLMQSQLHAASGINAADWRKERDQQLETLGTAITALQRKDAMDALGELFDIMVKIRLPYRQAEALSRRLNDLVEGYAQPSPGQLEDAHSKAKQESAESLSLFLNFTRWSARWRTRVMNLIDVRERLRNMRRQGISTELLDYVHRHFREALTIRSLAEHVHMNPAYLGRSFQRAAGISLRQYINQLRVEEAKRLLLGTDRRIYEIAEELGFSDSSYFIAVFQRETGMRPNGFRHLS